MRKQVATVMGVPIYVDDELPEDVILLCKDEAIIPSIIVMLTQTGLPEIIEVKLRFGKEA